MIQQSVNFLNVLPKSTNRIPPWLMALAVLVTLIILATASLFTYLSYARVKASLRLEEQAFNNVNTQYNNLLHKYPLLAQETPLINEVHKLEQQYNSKLLEFNALKHLVVRPGFSGYMLNLAQIVPNTLWLNRLQINHSLAQVILNGYAMRPDSVSELMRRLVTTPSFSNVLFSSFFVRAVKNHSYVRFSISSHEINLEEVQEEERKEAEAEAQAAKKAKELQK